jgi:hypothetical protein
MIQRGTLYAVLQSTESATRCKHFPLMRAMHYYLHNVFHRWEQKCPFKCNLIFIRITVDCRFPLRILTLNPLSLLSHFNMAELQVFLMSPRLPSLFPLPCKCDVAHAHKVPPSHADCSHVDVNRTATPHTFPMEAASAPQDEEPCSVGPLPLQSDIRLQALCGPSNNAASVRVISLYCDSPQHPT